MAKKSVIEKLMNEDERLLTVEPWAASGPGWSSRGVTVYFENRLTGKLRSETLYERDLPVAAQILFPHALSLHASLTRALERPAA